MHDKRCRDVQLGNLLSDWKQTTYATKALDLDQRVHVPRQITRTASKGSLVFQNGACGHIIPIALYTNSIARLVNDPATLGPPLLGVFGTVARALVALPCCVQVVMVNRNAASLPLANRMCVVFLVVAHVFDEVGVRQEC